jgi:hypothetical protein
MKHSYFSDKDLKVIRDIAVQLYLDTEPGGKIPLEYNFQCAVEATRIYLARMDKMKDE